VCRKVVWITSLTDYVNHIAGNCTGEHFLFRGQLDGEALLPRFGRPPLHPDPVNTEVRMREDLERCSPRLLGRLPANRWEWLALGQHYRMPTRLLDWTFNALAALWFAVSRRQAAQGRINGAVWALEFRDEDIIVPRKKDDPHGIKRTGVLLPKHIEGRIAAQSGCFTVHRYDDGDRRYIALDEDPLHKDHLTKLVVAEALFGDLRDQLHRVGVNQSMLFPDMDGLCAHLDWFHRRPHGSGAAAQSGCT